MKKLLLVLVATAALGAVREAHNPKKWVVATKDGKTVARITENLDKDGDRDEKTPFKYEILNADEAFRELFEQTYSNKTSGTLLWNGGIRNY